MKTGVKKAILRILEITDLGFVNDGRIEIVDTVPLKNQQVVLFRHNNGIVFAYRKLKTPGKIHEYSKIVGLQDQLSCLPKVYYFNATTKEAITEWAEGEQLGYFDSRKQLPPPNDTELDLLIELMVDLHRHISTRFNAVEEEPAMERITVDFNDLSPANKYFEILIRNYDQGLPCLTRGKRKTNLDRKMLSEIERMIESGRTFLLNSKKGFSLIPYFSLLHGDLHPENIIRTPDHKIRLIDFEHLHYGDHAWELAFFLEQVAQAGFIDEKRKQRFVKNYQIRLTSTNSSLEDATFLERLKIYEVYVTFKFLELICGGLASTKPNKEINLHLLTGVLGRARQLQL